MQIFANSGHVRLPTRSLQGTKYFIYFKQPKKTKLSRLKEERIFFNFFVFKLKFL